MNRKILQKALDALNKTDFNSVSDISYVRGILETLLESLPQDQFAASKLIGGSNIPPLPPLDGLSKMKGMVEIQ